MTARTAARLKPHAADIRFQRPVFISGPFLTKNPLAAYYDTSSGEVNVAIKRKNAWLLACVLQMGADSRA
jgi:hypothetical protein